MPPWRQGRLATPSSWHRWGLGRVGELARQHCALFKKGVQEVKKSAAASSQLHCDAGGLTEIVSFTAIMAAAQAAAPQRVQDVHLKHAMFLEDNGHFADAEAEFVNAGGRRAMQLRGLNLGRIACLVPPL
jgi:hypothetical protein